MRTGLFCRPRNTESNKAPLNGGVFVMLEPMLTGEWKLEDPKIRRDPAQGVLNPFWV